ncbi:hypothetical protein ACPA54_22330 [Uniformispora flossi]|uniref:hypothetical protein n=1 Tax=Uniformispora flossi TaxID=3390723 RepID=UPI003C2CD4EE
MTTDFSKFSHQQLMDMVAQVSPESATGAALRLIFVSQQLKDAATTLDLKLADSMNGWTGVAADSFHTWATAVTQATHQLSQYSMDMGKQVGQVASAAGGATAMPKLPTAEMAKVETVKAMTAPTEVDALDGVNAMAYVELQRQEAISTLTRIAHGYDQAVVAMDQGVPPSYPPPANIYEVPIDTSRNGFDAPGGGGAGSRTSAGSTTRGTTGGTTGNGQSSSGAAAPSPPMQTLAEGGGGTVPVTSPTSGVDLAGNGTLHADQTGPLTTAGPTPMTNVPGEPAKYGLPTGLPPMGGTPVQLPSSSKPGLPGEAGRSGVPAFGKPGVSGGKAVSNPREVAPLAGPRGVPGNTLRTGPIEGGTPMRGPGVPPGEAPRGLGRGGMPVSGGTASPGGTDGRAGTPRSSVRTPGGTVGGEPTGGVGGRPFSRGGSGIRVTPAEGARPGEASPTGRAMPNGATSPTRQERRRRRRAEYLEEDESTWTAHGQPVPPVVD